MVVGVLLVLGEDRQLEGLLLLVKEAGVGRVHGRLVGLLLLVGGDVLVVLELLHARLGLFALFAAALFARSLRLALLYTIKTIVKK